MRWSVTGNSARYRLAFGRWLFTVSNANSFTCTPIGSGEREHL
jgi:hypothetical protein